MACHAQGAVFLIPAQPEGGCFSVKSEHRPQLYVAFCVQFAGEVPENAGVLTGLVIF